MDEVTSQEGRSESWRDIVSILFIAYLTPVAAIPVWLISRWSALTKWIVTAISIIALILLYYTSYSGYQFAKFQDAYKPVLEVQQALDIYGIEKGQYPENLEALKPKYLKEIPSTQMTYEPLEEGKNYSLKATIKDRNVDLGPVLKSE